jgi:hypothetical protein
MFADVKHLMHCRAREWRSALAQQLHFEMFERVHVMPQNNSARLTGCSQA